MGDFGEWHVGDPIGFGNDTGAPEVPYMSYGPREGEDGDGNDQTPEEIEDNRKRWVSKTLLDEASRLYDEERYPEALTLINLAIENYPARATNWNLKALIVERMGQFDEALSCYDEALKRRPSDKTINCNKAVFLTDRAWEQFESHNIHEASNLVGQALKIYSKIDNYDISDSIFDLKAEIALVNEDYVEAFDCYKHALEIVKDDDELMDEYKRKRDNLLKYFNVKKVRCPKCGKKVPITDSFCIRCGAHIEINNLKQKDVLKKSNWGEATILGSDEDI